MSVRVMTAVFERYPNGGGEMLLALALADHASDDGTRVYPSIKALAEKTRQSERTVQYQLRRMQDSGWIALVNEGHGGRSMHNEYAISSDWLKGADIAPFQKGATERTKGATDDIKGAIHDTKGCNPRQERVQPVAPANNHEEPSLEPSKNHKSAGALVGVGEGLGLDDVDQQVLADYIALRKKRKADITPTVVADLRVEAAKAGMSVDGALRMCIRRAWTGFDASWVKPSTQSQAGQGVSVESFRERDERLARERYAAFTGPSEGAADHYPAANVIDVSSREIPNLIRHLGASA